MPPLLKKGITQLFTSQTIHHHIFINFHCPVDELQSIRYGYAYIAKKKEHFAIKINAQVQARSGPKVGQTKKKFVFMQLTFEMPHEP